MRIIFNVFNNKNKAQHIIGNIDIVLEKNKSYSELNISYKLKNGYIFIDHNVEDGIYKSYLYKYCYFEKGSVYGEELQEKPIMLPPYITKDTGERISQLKGKTEIKYLPDEDILYIAFLWPFGKTQTIDSLIDISFDKAVNKLIEFVRDNEPIKRKITDLYLNENRKYFLYERIHDYKQNDDDENYRIKLLGYTTNKELADEIYTNGYFSGRDIVVTDEMPKIQSVLIERPKWVYVEVSYEEEDIKDIVGLKKSAYFNFRFIQPNSNCSALVEHDELDRLLNPTMVVYEKGYGHFWFKYEITDIINKEELSQQIQDLAIHYILFRERYEKLDKKSEK